MRSIFQTLKDKNPEDVEKLGPFLCKRENAWLHNGYYFWDQDIDIAHWWGEKGYRGSYIICKSSFEYNIKLCWDLHNEHSAREEFRKIVNAIKKRNINSKKEIKVRDIIEELQTKGIFKYKAIRLAGINSIGHNDVLYERHVLDKKKYSQNNIIIKEYDNRPAIQICFYEKFALKRKLFKIVFPEQYIKDEIVF
ncbi:hypothetical protein LB456_03025 [Psychroflexus sp. CAK57W]|uniref:hypothetical protein n=1 Tax=Psychroflexus curvus TaxID=2873595 RepID=UPI001CCD94CB|nr:hypothetical protein [Psychroflexus curvus]MBZ9786419.1 hypothetical protein [Psychroflexus curvus]